MAFGPIMKLQTSSGLHIELAPFSREEAAGFAEGFQQASITQFLHTDIARTVEMEYEWYDKVIKDESSRLWGIWVTEKNHRTLIGNTVIEKIEGQGLTRGTTGIVIIDKNYWGKGVATVCHKARTWYVFEQLGLNRLLSYIYEGNEPSARALEHSGYFLHHLTRNELFHDGAWKAVNVMECLNPSDWAWRLWWGDDRPTRKAVEARELTRAALDWAKKNVDLV